MQDKMQLSLFKVNCSTHFHFPVLLLMISIFFSLFLQFRHCLALYIEQLYLHFFTVYTLHNCTCCLSEIWDHCQRNQKDQKIFSLFGSFLISLPIDYLHIFHLRFHSWLSSVSGRRWIVLALPERMQFCSFHLHQMPQVTTGGFFCLSQLFIFTVCIVLPQFFTTFDISSVLQLIYSHRKLQEGELILKIEFH